MRFSSAGEVMLFFLSLRSRLAGLPRIMWLLPALPLRTRPEPVTHMRFAADRFVFIFGICPRFRLVTSAHAAPSGVGQV